MKQPRWPPRAAMVLDQVEQRRTGGSDPVVQRQEVLPVMADLRQEVQMGRT